MPGKYVELEEALLGRLAQLVEQTDASPRMRDRLLQACEAVARAARTLALRLEEEQPNLALASEEAFEVMHGAAAEAWWFNGIDDVLLCFVWLRASHAPDVPEEGHDAPKPPLAQLLADACDPSNPVAVPAGRICRRLARVYAESDAEGFWFAREEAPAMDGHMRSLDHGSRTARRWLAIWEAQLLQLGHAPVSPRALRWIASPHACRKRDGVLYYAALAGVQGAWMYRRRTQRKGAVLGGRPHAAGSAARRQTSRPVRLPALCVTETSRPVRVP